MAATTFDYYSAQLVALDAVAPRTMEEGTLMGGKLRMKYAEYTVPAGGVATGKRIEMIRLPVGCRIMPGSCVITEDMGSSTTLSIGYNQVGGATSADAQFAAATSVATAGANLPFVSTMLGDKLLYDTSLYVVTGGASLTAAKKIKMFVKYLPVID